MIFFSNLTKKAIFCLKSLKKHIFHIFAKIFLKYLLTYLLTYLLRSNKSGWDELQELVEQYVEIREKGHGLELDTRTSVQIDIANTLAVKLVPFISGIATRIISDGKGHKLTTPTRTSYLSNNLNQVPLEDLIQEGQIAIIKSLHRYDPSKGRLATFLSGVIGGHIHRYSIDQSSVIPLPSYVSDIARPLVKAHNRSISIKNLIRRYAVMGKRLPHEVAAAIYVGVTNETINLDESLFSQRLRKGSVESFESRYLEDKDSPSPEETTIRYNLQDEVHNSLDLLPRRERVILQMRFGIGFDKEFSLEEIGDLFEDLEGTGLTRERIRQLEARALGRFDLDKYSKNLRTFVDEDFIEYNPLSVKENVPKKESTRPWQVEALEKNRYLSTQAKEKISLAIEDGTKNLAELSEHTGYQENTLANYLGRAGVSLASLEDDSPPEINNEQLGIESTLPEEALLSLEDKLDRSDLTQKAKLKFKDAFSQGALSAREIHEITGYKMNTVRHHLFRANISLMELKASSEESRGMSIPREVAPLEEKQQSPYNLDEKILESDLPKSAKNRLSQALQRGVSNFEELCQVSGYKANSVRTYLSMAGIKAKELTSYTPNDNSPKEAPIPETDIPVESPYINQAETNSQDDKTPRSEYNGTESIAAHMLKEGYLGAVMLNNLLTKDELTAGLMELVEIDDNYQGLRTKGEVNKVVDFLETKGVLIKVGDVYLPR